MFKRAEQVIELGWAAGCRHPDLADAYAGQLAASAIAPPANAPPVPLRSRLSSLRSSFVPPLIVRRFVSVDGQSTSLRTRRTPVASSQTSHAAKPGSPTNSSGEPSAMARL